MTKSVIAKNAQCNAIVDLLDTGNLAPSGKLRIYTSDSTVLATHNLSYPAFGSAADGTATANAIADVPILATGTASTFSVLNRDSSFVWSGAVTVNGGGGWMQLANINFLQDATSEIASFIYVVP